VIPKRISTVAVAGLIFDGEAILWSPIGTLRHHLLPMARVDALVSAKIRCVHSLATQHRDQCQDTASKFIEAVPG
jgi:hypothetical protein